MFSRASRPAAMAAPVRWSSPSNLHTLAARLICMSNRIAPRAEAEGRASGTPASLATIWRAVAALDVTQKKRSGPPNTIDLTSRPRGSCGTPPLPTWDPTRLVFLNETGITNNLPAEGVVRATYDLPASVHEALRYGCSRETLDALIYWPPGHRRDFGIRAKAPRKEIRQ